MDTVLICAVGETPQVVTETLYALWREGVVPAEIHVLTTALGRQRVVDQLLNRQTGRFYRFCKEYEIDHRTIAFDRDRVWVLQDGAGRELEDLRTREENAAAGSWIAAFVRHQADRGDVVLHASLAGGRKTMSYYLGYAMQMFGRRHDRLTHVLVSEALETHPEFYYPPKKPATLQTRSGDRVRADRARMDLVDVPFLRLRDHLRLDEIHDGFERAVADAQRQVDRAAGPDLVVDVASGALRRGGRTCRLGAGSQLFALYVHFLFERLLCGGDDGGTDHFRPAFDASDDSGNEVTPMLDPDERADVWQRAAERLGAGAGLDGLRTALEADALNPYGDRFREQFPSKVSKINRKLKTAFGEVGAEPLLVVSDGRRPARYGVRLPAGRIRFEIGGGGNGEGT